MIIGLRDNTAAEVGHEMKTRKCALNWTTGRSLDPTKSYLWTMGAEATLKWDEDEGKKGKTMYNFPKEIHGSWREASRFFFK